jgi:hypothetical protein
MLLYKTGSLIQVFLTITQKRRKMKTREKTIQLYRYVGNYLLLWFQYDLSLLNFMLRLNPLIWGGGAFARFLKWIILSHRDSSSHWMRFRLARVSCDWQFGFLRLFPCIISCYMIFCMVSSHVIQYETLIRCDYPILDFQSQNYEIK